MQGYLRYRLGFRCQSCLLALYVVFSWFAVGCAPSMTARYGLDTYDDIEVQNGDVKTFASEDGAPGWVPLLISLATRVWNEALGREALRPVASAKADVLVEVDAQDVPKEGQVGWCDIEACGEAKVGRTECRIVLEAPRDISVRRDFHLRRDILQPSVYDKDVFALADGNYEQFVYLKMNLVILTHEMGHAIGLGHTEDFSSCIMNPNPSGALRICDFERVAASYLMREKVKSLSLKNPRFRPAARP